MKMDGMGKEKVFVANTGLKLKLLS